MRQELLDPLKGNELYETAVKLVRRIYRLIDDGTDYSETLVQLSKLARKELSGMELEDAAELIEPEAYAFALVSEFIPVPTDLSYEEMLELIGQIATNEGEVPQLSFWARCVEVNTGDKRIETLISAPELYFDDPSAARRLSAREILDTALAAGQNNRGQHGLTNG